VIKDWLELTRLTGGEETLIERVRLPGKDISIEGSFELPPLARLNMEDQVFVAAFVKSHGSIKQMERLFGVSYPTIKNRLNRISGELDFVDVGSVPSQGEALELLERGEITVEEAVERLRRCF
jgi:hypothetical protein